MLRNVYVVPNNVNLNDLYSVPEVHQFLNQSIISMFILFYTMFLKVLFLPVYTQEEDQEATWAREPRPRPRR